MTDDIVAIVDHRAVQIDGKGCHAIAIPAVDLVFRLKSLLEQIEIKVPVLLRMALKILKDRNALAHGEGSHCGEVFRDQARLGKPAQTAHGEYKVLGVPALIHVFVAQALKIEQRIQHAAQLLRPKAGEKAQQLALAKAGAHVLRRDGVDAKVGFDVIHISFALARFAKLHDVHKAFRAAARAAKLRYGHGVGHRLLKDALHKGKEAAVRGHGVHGGAKAPGKDDENVRAGAILFHGGAQQVQAQHEAGVAPVALAGKGRVIGQKGHARQTVHRLGRFGLVLAQIEIVPHAARPGGGEKIAQAGEKRHKKAVHRQDARSLRLAQHFQQALQIGGNVLPLAAIENQIAENAPRLGSVQADKADVQRRAQSALLLRRKHAALLQAFKETLPVFLTALFLQNARHARSALIARYFCQSIQ